jgi:hypothetical protein
VTSNKGGPRLKSVVRLVASDGQRRSQARVGDVDRDIDLSYNGGGFGKGARFPQIKVR